ncbi:MAG: pyridoxamine 5'-phosphate oxidase family protein [Steroidobacterales bacterium]
MNVIDKTELLAYMRQHQHVVLSSLAADGAPQAALVGVAILDSMELVFDTVTTSRKHANLLRDRRAAVTFSGPNEQTLQLEGIAYPVSLAGAADQSFREAYYRAWPDGRARLEWPGLCYWRVMPRWARYSDFNRGPLIAEFRWAAV